MQLAPGDTCVPTFGDGFAVVAAREPAGGPA
jgi:hypothetical protein